MDSGYPEITRRRWIKAVGAVGVAPAAGLAGCLGDGDEMPQHYVDGEFVGATGSDAETLLHHQTTDSQSGSAVGLTLDGAYSVTPEVEVHPKWMDLVTADDEGRVYVATLRDGLEWSDPYGEMTADDWVYHVREIHQGEDNWAGSVDAADWAGVEVDQTGTLEFEIELPAPNPDFPFEPVLWEAKCYPRDLIEPYVEERDAEGLSQDETLNELGYTGNLGPYTLERWDRDSRFVAVANPDYYVRDLDDVPELWNDAPHFDAYSYRVVREESTRLEALRAQEVTSAAIPRTRVEEFEAEPHVDVNHVPQPFLSLLAYNQRRNGWAPFRDRRVRQAFSTAVDKHEIVDNILRGHAEVAHTFQPRWSEWFVDDEVTRYGEGDRHSYEEARSTLEDALDDHEYDGDDLVDADGDQVELTLVYTDAAETTATTAEFVAQELGEVGVSVELENVSGDRLLERYVQNEWVGEGEPPWNAGPNNAGPRDDTESASDWDMMYGLAFNTYPRTPSATDAFWHERAPTNYFGYVPEEDLKSMFDAARTEVDVDRRREIYGEVFGVLSHDQPVNFVFMFDDIVGYQEYVEGPEEVFGHGWNALQTWRFAEI